MSLLDRIQKLVALGTSSNEHEAGNAARQACRLIREHRIVLRERTNEDAREEQEARKAKARKAREERGDAPGAPATGAPSGWVCGIHGVWCPGERAYHPPGFFSSALSKDVRTDTAPLVHHLTEDETLTLCGRPLGNEGDVPSFFIERVNLRRGIRLCRDCVRARTV